MGKSGVGFWAPFLVTAIVIIIFATLVVINVGFKDFPLFKQANVSSNQTLEDTEQQTTQCSDDIDNDNDGWIDFDGNGALSRMDPGCASFEDNNESFIGNTECSNEVDDHDAEDTLGDGNDPECFSFSGTNETFQGTLLDACNDGIDNDQDSLVDWPIDPGCSSPDGTDENEQEISQTTSWAYVGDSRGAYDSSNIAPMHYLIVTDPITTDPVRVKEFLDAQPEGRRAILSWDAQMAIHTNTSDYCRNSTSVTNYSCIWWENGVQQSYEIFDNFFRQYKAIGGKVDVIVLDYEQNWALSNWGFGVNCPGGVPNVEEELHWKAIENDPRFPVIAQQLGFSNLTTVHCPFQGATAYYYQTWNDLMRNRAANYVNQGVYNAIKTHYPNVEMSDWDYHHHDLSRWYVPDANGNNFSNCAPGLYCSTGTHVGTHQTFAINYGILGAIGYHKLDGVNNYAITPFNSLKYDSNLIRSSLLANPSVPIAPWIAYRSHEGLIKDNDFYQEILLHSLLTGTDYFLYWNPRVVYGPPHNLIASTDADNVILSKTMKEFDSISGFNDKHTLVSDIVPWDSDFVLTGMQAGGRKVWRFTPENMQNTLASETSQSIIFQTSTKQITIPQGRIWRPSNPVSQKGYWIVQPLNAPNPTISNR